jgi:hypothetical protein
MGLGGFGDVVLWVYTRASMFGGNEEDEERSGFDDKQEESYCDQDREMRLAL